MQSLVLEFPAPTPQQSMDFMLAKLCYHTDAADLAQDLQNRISEIVVVDTRSAAHYAAGHIPGAIGFPLRLLDAALVTDEDRQKTYVTYCDGIGCNGSTKGAYKLAKLGFKVKELLGGIDFWLRDGLPLASGELPGEMPVGELAITCSC